MKLRIARGLFRLWIVGAVLWVGGVAATTTWSHLVYYQPVIVGEQPSGRLQATSDACASVKNAKECSDILTAAGKNPFDAFDLKWDGTGWAFPDNAVMEPAGVAWEEVWRRVALALVPPVSMLVTGWALIWAFRGFRS
jgi:hypothetical protein